MKKIVIGTLFSIPISISIQLIFANNEKSHQYPPINISPYAKSALVKKVIDGDKIIVFSEGKNDKIRLCGINAPELTQPLGLQSKVSLESLIDQGNGEIYILPVKRDRFGYMVAEVYINPNQPNDLPTNDLSYLQVSNGMGYFDTTFSEGCKNLTNIAKVQVEAKKKNKGIWNQ